MEKNKKEKSVVICDAVCGILFMVAVLVYVILGLAINWWHPGWTILVAVAVVDAIASIVSSMIVELKKSEKETKEEKTETETDAKK